MTEPDRPADAPAGPTPEEISARLEALLKRTHALRASKAAEPSTPLSMTWPPPDRELDHYDVVDVPEDDRMTAAAPPSPPAPVTPSAPPSPATTTMQDAAAETNAESFARPDWSELRLRSQPEEPAGLSRGWLAVVVLLALATAGQAAYIWTRLGSTPAESRLRVDGPDGAEVRVNGQAIGPAPIDHALSPGDYDIEVGTDATTARAQRVSIGVGRTVVLMPTDAPTAPPTAAPSTATTAASTSAPVSAPPAARPLGSPERATAIPTPTPGGATPNPAATAPAAVSAARGGVLIESTPSGLPVTMEGRERGVTPITIGQLKPGRHDVLVGGLPRKVDITAGTVTSLRVDRP